MRLLSLLFVGFFWAVHAAAEISGERDPVFRSALAQWLEGQDDLAALHGLAALARDGNTAAQVTLGLIEGTAGQNVHLIGALSREVRRAIFRDAEGRFGRPWFRVAGQKSALAAVRAAPISAENAVTGYAAGMAEGDLRMAWQSAFIHFNFTGMPSSAQRFAERRLRPHAHAVLAWILAGFESADAVAGLSPEEQGVVADIRAALASDPAPTGLLPALSTPMHGLRDLEAKPDDLRRTGASLLDESALQPIAEVVRAACPEDSALHMGVLAAGPSNFPLTLIQTSPFVPIVDTEAWQHSARFGRDTLREIMRAPGHIALVERLSPCLARAAR